MLRYLRIRRSVDRKGVAFLGLVIAVCCAGSCLVQVTLASADGRLDTTPTQQWRGVVRPVRQAAISTEVVAPVAAIGVREGQRFAHGDRLVEFDCRRQHHELAAIGAAVREAQVTHASNAHLARNGASNRNDVAIAQARLDKVSAEHAALKQRLEGCLIVAPFDGVVLELGVNAHELPQPSRPLMTIVSDRDLEIEVIVPSRDLPRLVAGAAFEFTADETQRVYVCTVLRTGGAVDPMSQTAKIYARFDAGADDVVPGMSGTAVLKGARQR
jgi:membrane fusion protein (multidrug efflux system)